MYWRTRDLLMLACALRGVDAVGAYYGLVNDHPRTLLDGLGYVLFSAAIIYGIGWAYDHWRAVRHHSQ